jgi:hypothetical protein
MEMKKMEIHATDYKAGINEQSNIVLSGSTFASKIKNLKKMANINCRSTHLKQTIFSEFRRGSFGYYFWNRSTGCVDAWIVWG